MNIALIYMNLHFMTLLGMEKTLKMFGGKGKDFGKGVKNLN